MKPFDGRQPQARTVTDATGVTFSGGSATITHGGSTAPTFVSASISGSTYYVAFVPTITATTFTVTARIVTDGTAIPNGAQTVRWLAAW